MVLCRSKGSYSFNPKTRTERSINERELRRSVVLIWLPTSSSNLPRFLVKATTRCSSLDILPFPTTPVSSLLEVIATSSFPVTVTDSTLPPFVTEQFTLDLSKANFKDPRTTQHLPCRLYMWAVLLASVFFPRLPFSEVDSLVSAISVYEQHHLVFDTASFNSSSVQQACNLAGAVSVQPLGQSCHPLEEEELRALVPRDPYMPYLSKQEDGRHNFSVPRL